MQSEETTFRGVTMAWSAQERLAVFRYEDDGALTGEAAAALLPVFERWVGRGPEPYGILVDAASTRGSNPEWRVRWADFHKREGGRARIAVHGASLFVRSVLWAYPVLTGTQVRFFGAERDARAWLRDAGVPVAASPS